MARPQIDALYYFPHDTNAASDEKIELMRAEFGNDGYAFFFIMLERIYRNMGELDLSTDAAMKIAAKQVQVPMKKFKKMLEFSINLGLFCKNSFKVERKLTSNGVKKRSKKMNSKRERDRDRYAASKEDSYTYEEIEEKQDESFRRGNYSGNDAETSQFRPPNKSKIKEKVNIREDNNNMNDILSGEKTNDVVVDESRDDSFPSMVPFPDVPVGAVNEKLLIARATSAAGMDIANARSEEDHEAFLREPGPELPPGTNEYGGEITAWEWDFLFALAREWNKVGFYIPYSNLHHSPSLLHNFRARMREVGQDRVVLAVRRSQHAKAFSRNKQKMRFENMWTEKVFGKLLDGRFDDRIARFEEEKGKGATEQFKQDDYAGLVNE